MERWIAVSGTDAPKVSGLNAPRAWLAYRISAVGRLQRADGAQPSGGVMVVSGSLGPLTDATVPAQDIFMECSRQRFSAVALDFEDRPDIDSLRALAGQLLGRGLALMVPEALHSHVPEAKVIVSTATTGGSFEAMLDAAAARHGANNICLELDRMCHDFAMPSAGMPGNRLSHSQLAEIKARCNPTPRLCPTMRCRYFTYMAQDSPRYVLFDDLASARSKIKCAQEKGAYGAFVLYSQWQAGAASLI